MQMVGADNGFIKRPYLRAAFWLSAKAVLAVVVFVSGLCIYLIQSNSVFSEIIQWEYVALTILISFFAAFLIQFLTTNMIINQFLRRESR